MMRHGLLVIGLAVLGSGCADGPTSVSTSAADYVNATWQSVTVGRDHSCAIDTQGRAFCWGSNQYGQLGVLAVDTVCGPTANAFPCSLVPVAVSTAVRFQSLSAGATHTCGISTQSLLYCWGDNSSDQVGGSSSGGATLVEPDVTDRFVAVSAGYSHSCAIRSGGTILCWGANDEGEVGNGAADGAMTPTPTPISGGQRYTVVSAGQQRSCGLTTAGVPMCWGEIWDYRDDNFEWMTAQLTPIAVPNAPSLDALSVGSFTTCAVGASGSGYCWGANPRGELGNGTTAGSTSPVAVAVTLAFAQVSSGLLQSCAVTANGSAYCWGDDSFGQLGLGPTGVAELCGTQQLPCATTPSAVVGTQSFATISTGFGSHTCGVTRLGTIYCWGLGVSGQRGDGTSSVSISVPTQIAAQKTQ